MEGQENAPATDTSPIPGNSALAIKAFYYTSFTVLLLC
jgi:hypothetical protein